MIRHQSIPLCTAKSAGRWWIPIALILAGLLPLPRASFAASTCAANGNELVTVNATGVAFGSYDVFTATPTNGTGTITVSATCKHALGVYILGYQLALSTGSGGSFTPRIMNLGSAKLQYNLYTNSSLTSIWGDGSAGTQLVSDTLVGTCNAAGNNCRGLQNDIIYGNIPAMQNVVAGNYSDIINVTVTF